MAILLSLQSTPSVLSAKIKLSELSDKIHAWIRICSFHFFNIVLFNLSIIHTVHVCRTAWTVHIIIQWRVNRQCRLASALSMSSALHCNQCNKFCDSQFSHPRAWVLLGISSSFCMKLQIPLDPSSQTSISNQLFLLLFIAPEVAPEIPAGWFRNKMEKEDKFELDVIWQVLIELAYWLVYFAHCLCPDLVKI